MKNVATNRIPNKLWKYRVVVCCWSILLTGCMVGPNYHTPTESMPSHFTNSKPHSSTKQFHSSWWPSLKDPMLVSLINQALHQNWDIQQAEAKIRQSRAELNISSADYFPQLNASGKISRDHLSANSELLSSIPFKIPLNYTDNKLEFDASWELDLFGHTRRSVEASNSTFQSTIENTNDTALRVAAEVAKNYIQYRTYQQRIIIAKHTIASYKKTAKLITLRMHAGNASSVDVERIESQALSAEASLPPLQAEMRATLAALAVMINEYPESLYTRLNQVARIPVIKSALSIGTPSDLLQKRPDIRAAERNLAAATANIGVATANQFPRFQLVGDIGSDTVVPGTFAQAASRYWSYGPQIYLPIFQAGRLRNAVKENKAMRDSIFAEYKKSVLQALADVESALIRNEKEKLREKNLLLSYKQIQSSVRLIQLQYVTGKSTLMDVLDVQRQADELHDQYVQAMGQVAINQVSLYKALGGAVMR